MIAVILAVVINRRLCSLHFLQAAWRSPVPVCLGPTRSPWPSPSDSRPREPLLGSRALLLLCIRVLWVMNSE